MAMAMEVFLCLPNCHCFQRNLHFCSIEEFQVFRVCWTFVRSPTHAMDDSLTLMYSRQQIGRIDYLRHLYLPTHARCGPWFVGMMLGFVMYRTRNKPLQLRAFVSRTLWVLSISLLFAVVLGFFPFQQPENLLTFSNTANATFNSLFRTCWAFGIAGIIFGCHNGSGSVVGWFLSLPQWQPLARMSLSVYLTHRIYQILSVASLRQPIHIVPSEILHVYFGDVIMSLIVGTLVYLCIEAPFSILEGRLFKSHAQSK